MKWPKLTLPTKILLGLILGAIFGIIANRAEWNDFVSGYVKPVGTAFVKLITMVVIPLVFSSLLVGTASLNDIRSLAFAPDGSLWAGTGSGVARWDLATDTHIRYSTADGLASDDVTDLAFAPDGTLWVAARGGVSHFDGTGWTAYTEADGLISNIVYAITTAPDGSVWVGTQDGASHFDYKRSGAVWTSYTMADGLAGNVVWYVAVAPDGDVWFSTHSGGVSRHNPDQNTWTTHSTEHGLPLPNARFLTIGSDGAPGCTLATITSIASMAQPGRWLTRPEAASGCATSLLMPAGCPGSPPVVATTPTVPGWLTLTEATGPMPPLRMAWLITTSPPWLCRQMAPLPLAQIEVSACTKRGGGARCVAAPP